MPCVDHPSLVDMLRSSLSLSRSVRSLPLLPHKVLARICYTAPYGCPDLLNGESGWRGFLDQAKAVAVMLGAVGALVKMLKRVNRRYHDVVTGGCIVDQSVRSG